MLPRVLVIAAVAMAAAGCAGPERAARYLPGADVLAGSATGGWGGSAVPEGWPNVSSTNDLLAPFLACRSPGEFIELQHRADMTRLVERLDPWSAVRLGSLGPVLAGADVLNRKRAEFLVAATEEYGPALAEVFALFIVHSAFTDDIREVLRLLAEDKRLGETLGRMGEVSRQLAERGIGPSEYKDRPERGGDVLRGLGRAATDALSTSELRRGAVAMRYYAQRAQLPPRYEQALVEVERVQFEAAHSTLNVLKGGFDHLTFGVPLGFLNLVMGTCHGVGELLQGHYEQGVREVAPAAVLVGLYAGGRALRPGLAAERGAGSGGAKSGWLPNLGFGGLEAVAQRLRERLGASGLVQLAKYLQARREAALLVYEGGELGAIGLFEASGDVAKARAWMSKAVQERPTGSGAAAAAATGEALGGLAALVDEGAGQTRAVLEVKLAEVEASAPGPRLSWDLKAVETAKPLLGEPPAGVPPSAALWREYVAYYERRLGEMRGTEKTGTQADVKPPLWWWSYESFRDAFRAAIEYQRARTVALLADAAKPRGDRSRFREFEKPFVQPNAGVKKTDLRFADVLIIEREVAPGRSSRVETVSFKRRDFRKMKAEDVRELMKGDAREAMRYYGGVLDIRTPGLGLRGQPVTVSKVHLVYDAKLKPESDLQSIFEGVAAETGVEVRFE